MSLVSSFVSRLLHQASFILSKQGEKDFVLACDDIETAQKRVLQRILTQIEGSSHSKQHSLSKHSSLNEFQASLEISDYDYWANQIAQQQAGEGNLLSKQECHRYQPTSGSTSKIKWIPYTEAFLTELDNAIAPWLADMYKNYPAIKQGKHYWSLSWVPSDLRNKLTTSINNDLQLLPWWKRLFMAATMAVPESISLAETSDESFFATACYLISCRDLTFISVWSPTFALSLLDFIQVHKRDIAQVLSSGQWPKAYSGLSQVKAPKNLKAANIINNWDGELNPAFTHSVWPKLALISAWDTSSSTLWAQKLHKLFPHSEFQGKGLWATEGVTSIPYKSQFPLAANSHFYEFEELSSKQVLTSWQLTKGMCVRPIISSANGLLRYAMKDQLKVTGFLNSCPCFEFIGRIDGTDMVGEKLSPEVAVNLINDFDQQYGVTPITLIALPANEIQDKPSYLLLCEGDLTSHKQDISTQQEQLAENLEQQLNQHFHYQLARELGQLGCAQVSIQQDALALYANHKIEQGMVKGNIKVEPLILWQNQASIFINKQKTTRQGEPA